MNNFAKTAITGIALAFTLAHVGTARAEDNGNEDGQPAIEPLYENTQLAIDEAVAKQKKVLRDFIKSEPAFHDYRALARVLVSENKSMPKCTSGACGGSCSVSETQQSIMDAMWSIADANGGFSPGMLADALAYGNASKVRILNAAEKIFEVDPRNRKTVTKNSASGVANAGGVGGSNTVNNSQSKLEVMKTK